MKTAVFVLMKQMNVDQMHKKVTSFDPIYFNVYANIFHIISVKFRIILFNIIEKYVKCIIQTFDIGYMYQYTNH